MSQGQQLAQGQTLSQELRLAPQQLQSLGLLAAPLMELENKITEELAVNPVLEIDDGPGEPEPESLDDSLPDTTAESLSVSDGPEHTLDDNRDDFSENLEKMLENGGESGWEGLTGGDFPDGVSGGEDPREQEDRRQYLFDSLTYEPSLQEQLLEQLRLSAPAPSLSKPAEEIIGSIDESGYLRTPLPDIAQTTGCSLDDAARALALVQSFEPAGIGARDLKECLLLQLERQGRGKSKLARLVRDYLDEIARNKFPQVAKAMEIPLDELNSLIAELKHLDLHPASSVSPSQPVYVTPEAFVEPDGGEFKVTPNDRGMPRLVISNRYLKLLEDPAVPDDAKKYIRQKLADGKLLLKSLDQRQSTILRIARLIVAAQHDFLVKGPEALRPMTMQEIADKMGLHETTVSRAIANKYLQTPSGLYRFRDFFSSGFQTETGAEVSAVGVKEIIRDAVAKEDSAAPLSDSRIEKLLKERGLNVARRTIAKYREELGIPSSQLRKVF